MGNQTRLPERNLQMTLLLWTLWLGVSADTMASRVLFQGRQEGKLVPHDSVVVLIQTSRF